MQKKISTRYIATVAMLAAISYIAVFVGRLVPNVAGFLSYDPKDAVVVISGFVLGPATSLLVSVIVSLAETVTVSGTGFYGLVMNVVSTCAFALPAAFIYKKFRTKKGAVIGLAVGVAAMAAVMVAWNYVITPLYMGVPRETVAGMLATVFLPFNLLKGSINAALTMLIYKPVVTALRKIGFVSPDPEGKKHRFSVVTAVVSAALIATFLLLLLALAGVI